MRLTPAPNTLPQRLIHSWVLRAEIKRFMISESLCTFPGWFVLNGKLKTKKNEEEISIGR